MSVPDRENRADRTVWSQRGVVCHDLRLDSGLRLLVCPVRSVPSVEIRLVLPYARDRDEDRAAMELVAASLLPEEDLTFAEHGGACDVVLDAESLVLTVGGRSEGLDDLLRALASIIVDPLHTPERLARARRRIGTGPGSGGTPGSAPSTVDAEEAGRIHRQRLRADHAVLCVVGDVDPDAAAGLAEDAFTSWEGGTPGEEPRHLEPRTFPGTPSVRRVHEAGAMGAHLSLEAPAVLLDHPDHTALHLANLTVGGSFSGRLVRSLRDRAGLAYSVHSTLQKLHRSAWISLTCYGPDAAPEQLLSETEQTLSELTAHGPHHAELAAVRQYAVGVSRVAARGNDGLAHAIAMYAAHGVSPLWMLGAAERCARVSDADVRRVLRDHFSPERFGGTLISDVPESAQTTDERRSPA